MRKLNSGRRACTSWTKTRAARSRASSAASHWWEIVNSLAKPAFGDSSKQTSTARRALRMDHSFGSNSLNRESGHYPDRSCHSRGAHRHGWQEGKCVVPARTPRSQQQDVDQRKTRGRQTGWRWRRQLAWLARRARGQRLDAFGEFGRGCDPVIAFVAGNQFLAALCLVGEARGFEVIVRQPIHVLVRRAQEPRHQVGIDAHFHQEILHLDVDVLWNAAIGGDAQDVLLPNVVGSLMNADEGGCTDRAYAA